MVIDCGHSHSNNHLNSIWQFDEGKTQLCLNALNIHWIYHLMTLNTQTRLKYQSSSNNNIYSSECWNQFDQFCGTNQGFVKLSAVAFFFLSFLTPPSSYTICLLEKKVNECSTSSFQNMNKIFKWAFFFLHVQHLRCLKGTRQLVNYSLCCCG